jgi:protein-L-isoaspartate O-methyltransferase
MPVGRESSSQQLVRITRTGVERYERDALEKVTFVPLIGAEGWPESSAA